MATQGELEERLREVQEKLGIDETFGLNNGVPLQQGTISVGVGSWPHDYIVDIEKLYKLLEPKELLLMAVRLAAP